VGQGRVTKTVISGKDQKVQKSKSSTPQKITGKRQANGSGKKGGKRKGTGPRHASPLKKAGGETLVNLRGTWRVTAGAWGTPLLLKIRTGSGGRGTDLQEEDTDEPCLEGKSGKSSQGENPKRAPVPKEDTVAKR